MPGPLPYDNQTRHFINCPPVKPCFTEALDDMKSTRFTAFISWLHFADKTKANADI